MKLLTTLVAIIMVFSFASLSLAETTNFTPVSGKTDGKSITSTAAKEKGPGMKAERGIKNILFGWTEIPRSIIQVTRDSKNPFWGLTGGTLKGIGKAFPRTVSGVSDVVSFPMGSYQKSPVKSDELKTMIK